MTERAGAQPGKKLSYAASCLVGSQVFPASHIFSLFDKSSCSSTDLFCNVIALCCFSVVACCCCLFNLCMLPCKGISSYIVETFLLFVIIVTSSTEKEEVIFKAYIPSSADNDFLHVWKVLRTSRPSKAVHKPWQT